MLTDASTGEPSTEDASLGVLKRLAFDHTKKMLPFEVFIRVRSLPLFLWTRRFSPVSTVVFLRHSCGQLCLGEASRDQTSVCRHDARSHIIHTLCPLFLQSLVRRDCLSNLSLEQVRCLFELLFHLSSSSTDRGDTALSDLNLVVGKFAAAGDPKQRVWALLGSLMRLKAAAAGHQHDGYSPYGLS